MNWPALNGRMCGVLIDFSLENGIVLFLKERIKGEKEHYKKEIVDIMEIGNYFSIYLEEKSGNSKNSHILLLGRLDDLHWKSARAIEDEYGVNFEDFEKEIKIKSTSVITTSAGFGDTMSINLLGNPHAVGRINFLGIPKKIPLTWMKVFEASKEDVRKVLRGTGAETGFEIKIGSEKWTSVDFQENHLTDNILIIGSYKSFLSLVFRQILKFSNLPKIVFTKKAETAFSSFDKISIHKFQKLISNKFGFEHCSDEQILNAATSLNPHQIRLLSNLLVQAKKEKKGESRYKNLKKVIDKNMGAYNGKYSEDLIKISNFLESKWDENKNLNNLISDNKITIVDVSQEVESKQIALSRFLHAVLEEINNRKRNKASLLEFILFIEDIEDCIPSTPENDLDSNEAISKEALKTFISYPDIKKIGLIMGTCFPSKIDPLIYYLCPNRLFGEVFEKRELMKIEEVFGINEVEIRKLRSIPKKRDEWGILLNFPSRFPVDVVDGILSEK